MTRLPPELQAILKYAAESASADMSWKAMDRYSKDLEAMKAEQGVKVHRTPDAVLQAQLAAWDKVIAAQSQEPFFAKVVEIQKAWAKRVVGSAVRDRGRPEDGLRSLLQGARRRRQDGGSAWPCGAGNYRGGVMPVSAARGAMKSTAPVVTACSARGVVIVIVRDLLVALCLWPGRRPRREQGPAAHRSSSASSAFGAARRLAAAHAEARHDAYSPLALLGGRRRNPRELRAQSRQAHARRSAGAPRLQRLLIPVDQVSTFVGKLFAWTIVILTFAVSYEVFSRYVFGADHLGLSMRATSSMARLFIMAGAYALSRNAHVRGDFLYRAWPPRRQAAMDLVLYFLFFFPGIIAFIYSGYGFAAQSWMTHEHSAYSPDGLPVYQYKTLIPVTGVLLLLQGIVEVIRCIVCLQARRVAAAAARRRGAGERHPRAAWHARRKSRRPAVTDPQLGVLMLVLFIFLIMLGFPDRLHADGDGRRLRLPRL